MAPEGDANAVSATSDEQLSQASGMAALCELEAELVPIQGCCVYLTLRTRLLPSALGASTQPQGRPISMELGHSMRLMLNFL